MNSITFGTSNLKKLSEASGILWLELKWYTQEDLNKIQEACGWDIKEIQSMDVIEIVKEKAKEAYSVLGRPIIVEDTWLYIETLKWFPGPLIKYVIEWPGLNAIFKMMDWVENRNAKAITWVCMYNWKDYIIWHWVLDWIITETPRWDKFWYSNGFEPLWNGKTFWEMTEQEKNEISMRKIAFLDFKRNFEEYQKG